MQIRSIRRQAMTVMFQCDRAADVWDDMVTKIWDFYLLSLLVPAAWCGH